MISLKEVREELRILGHNVKYFKYENAESIVIKIKKNVTIEKIVTAGKMWSIAEEYGTLKTDLLNLIETAKELKDYKGLEIKIISSRENYKIKWGPQKEELRTVFLKINNGSYRKTKKDINDVLLKVFLKEVLSKKRKE